MNAAEARYRWATKEGRKIIEAILLAVAGGDWVDEIYEFLNCAPENAEVDLSGIMIPPRTNLAKTDWSHLKLEFATFVDCDLTDANLQMSMLDHSRFDRAILRGANLVGCSIRESSFIAVDMSNSFAMDADLSGTDFNRAKFVGTALSRTKASSSVFFGAHFASTDLYSADWLGAKVDGDFPTDLSAEMVNAPAVMTLDPDRAIEKRAAKPNHSRYAVVARTGHHTSVRLKILQVKQLLADPRITPAQRSMLEKDLKLLLHAANKSRNLRIRRRGAKGTPEMHLATRTLKGFKA